MRSPLETVHAFGLPLPKGVLQVGANAGQELEYFQAAGIRSGAFIEPLDDPFAVLQERCAGMEGYIPIKALCGAINGEEVDFHVANNFRQSSSVLHPTGHLGDFPMVEFVATKKLTTFTLDRIFTTLQTHWPEVANDIRLLCMDVQGAELNVLKGATSVLQQVDYIYTEIGLGGGYANDVPVEELMMFLKAFGFRLAEAEFNVDGWGNATFIRRTERRWGR